MKRISSFIREDREFGESIQCIEETAKIGKKLPIVINGLAGGAHDAYVIECIREIRRITGRYPAVIAESDDACIRIAELLRKEGVDALHYKSRELVFNNISASHDIERERLSVLHRLLSEEGALVVASSSAILEFTMPRSVLLDSSLSLTLGMEISPDELAGKLENMGFRLSDTVEGRGAYARRGGIIDFFPLGDMPVRVEFFGDEIDRLVYFDPVTQRSAEACPRVEILPSNEVLVDARARANMLREVDILLKNRDLSSEMAEKLGKERASLLANLPLDFKDRYLGVIYEESESLIDYLDYVSGGAPSFIVLGTSAVREAALTFEKSISDKVSGLLSYGAANGRMARYALPFSALDGKLNESLAIHVNSF